tara:strand:- start:3428 stop:4264 length:837 start_codon:yes stop_codon:yes gene_type:complete
MIRWILPAAFLLLGSFQAQAARIITLAPHLAEMVCTVGACDELVGTINFSDFPEQVKALPRIGDARAINLEQVLSLQPDLILSWDGGTPEQTVARLRGLGLRVEPIRVQTLADVGLALLRIGALLGREDAACQVQGAFEQKIDSLRERYQHATPIRVMYQLEPEPVYTINADSPISGAIELCGAENIFADYKHLAGPVSREAVIAADPDVIIFGKQDDTDGIRRGWARFPGMRARRSDNLIGVDADTLARATTRMAIGTEKLCAVLDQARKRIQQLAE